MKTIHWWQPLACCLILCANTLAAKPGKPAGRPPAAPQPALLAGLADEDFATREKAEASLWDWALEHPSEAREKFWTLSRTAADPEVRDRCLNLLRRQVLRERDAQGSGFIGISMQAQMVTPPRGEEQPAVRVTDIIPMSGAVNSGLRIGDLILKFNGRKLAGQVPNGFQNQEDAVGFRLSEWVREHKPGETIVLQVLRGDELLDIKVVLGLYRPSVHSGLLLDQSSYEERIRREDELYFQTWLEAKRSQKE